MRNDWILAVLTDLKTFAQDNGLGGLSEQLDDTMLIAAAELASACGREQDFAFAEQGKAGAVHQLHSPGGNA